MQCCTLYIAYSHIYVSQIRQLNMLSLQVLLVAHSILVAAIHALTHLGARGRVWLVEEGEDLGLRLLPERQLPGQVVLLPPELARHLLLRRLLRLDVQLVQDRQSRLKKIYDMH